jgi:hypothetical protein
MLQMWNVVILVISKYVRCRKGLNHPHRILKVELLNRRLQQICQPQCLKTAFPSHVIKIWEQMAVTSGQMRRVGRKLQHFTMKIRQLLLCV